MHKPCSILRLLTLVALIGGLGIVKSTEAQQTVTLSGRVTDTTGNAVRDAFVTLFRMPGYIWVDEPRTDEDGAYRFSVPPGTYFLAV